MHTHNNIPENSSRKEQGKDKHFQNQYKQAFAGFFKQPQTMKELSVATGIDRANLCRYVRVMQKAGSIAVLKRTICRITKHRANQYTSNPKLLPKTKQLSLFGDWGADHNE